MKEQIQTSFARYEKNTGCMPTSSRCCCSRCGPISRQTATAVTLSVIFIMTPPIGS